MEASHDHKDSAGQRATAQASNRHNNQTKTKHGRAFPTRLVAWPFRITQQAWKDYRSGRNMRMRTTQEQASEAGGDQHSEEEKDTNKQSNDQEIPMSAIQGSPPSNYHHENPSASRAQPRRGAVVEHWVHQGGEWPWRIEQVVHRDSSENVRGIWVLEAKDLHAMRWETKDRPGRRIPATVPQPQWPFPLSRKKEDGEDESSAKEPDELMAWLRR
ncbi:hypothetical protein F5Y01DRAFT_324325 [Xylaria sp. FL0043]|nr:hypothetical protein F5Y01DRAFT_324325 [Xylaria sp. FL0043]